MKSVTFLLSFLLVVFFKSPAKGQELVCTNRIDTSVYEIADFTIIPIAGPETAYYEGRGRIAFTTMLSAYRKKGTDQFDIFSFTGKVGTVTIIGIQGSNIFVFPSQKFIDNDDEWEYIVNKEMPSSFSVIDDDQSVLLSGSGNVDYGFDGENTYVLDRYAPNPSFPEIEQKVWRFRTNVASNAPPSLSKSTTSPLHPIMTYGLTGNYRVSLAPSGEGKTTLQLFDMLGRCIFARQIDNITKPVTFTVPEERVPRSPFVA